MDKQMLKYFGILGVLIVVMILFFMITGSGGGKYEYRDIELLMVRAARKYATENPKILPSSENSSQTISSKTLINLGYLEDLSTYAMDETNCNGSVEIYQTISGIYNYVPTLNCGKYFNSKKLSEKIIEDNYGGTTQGPGLYVRYDGKFLTDENDIDRLPADEYVFRGDTVNNYILVEDMLWRVVSIDKDGNIIAIMVDNIKGNTTWDNRYNAETLDYDGVNEYEMNGIKSRIMQSAEDIFNEKVALIDKLYSGRIKYLVAPMDVCVGKRSPSDEGNDGSVECQKVLENQYIAALPVYSFMSASLDENCVRATSKSCGNYNFLASVGSGWWTATGNADNTSEAYVLRGRVLISQSCSYRDGIHPIIAFGSRSMYSKGSGTYDDPYILRYFMKNA